MAWLFLERPPGRFGIYQGVVVYFVSEVAVFRAGFFDIDRTVLHEISAYDNGAAVVAEGLDGSGQPAQGWANRHAFVGVGRTFWPIAFGLRPDRVVMDYRRSLVAAGRAVELQHDLLAMPIENRWADFSAEWTGRFGLGRQVVVEFHEPPHGLAMFFHRIRSCVAIAASRARPSLANVGVGDLFYHIAFLCEEVISCCFY